MKIAKKYSDIEELIIRFLDGSIDEEDKQILFQWIVEDEKNERKFNELSLIWDASQLAGIQHNPEIIWENLISGLEKPVARKTYSLLRSSFSYRLLAVASVLLLLIILTPLYFLSDKESAIAEVLLEWNMPAHSKGNVELNDHSVVWLNQNSTLSYPETFSGDTRMVKVTGEACFEVARDENKPFIVDLGGEKVRVLGTVFNVKNQDNEAEITLISGSIEFLSGKETIRLKPDEKITYNKTTGKWLVEAVDASIYNIWTKDRLTFDNEDLLYIIACLEKWYDIQIEPSLSIENISGISLSVRNEQVSEVLSGIEKITSVKFKTMK